MEYLAPAVATRMPEIYEDYDNRPAWSATPVGLASSPFLQLSFAENFSQESLPQRMAPYVAGAPDETAELVMGSMGNANHRRGIHNADSFTDRRVQEIPEHLAPLNKAAQEGYATPAGLLRIASELGMRSIELTKISYDGEQWQDARDDVAKAANSIAGRDVWLADGPIDKGPEYGTPAYQLLDGPVRQSQGLTEHDKVLRREELGLDEFDEVGPLLGFYVRFRKYRGAINESTHLREVQSYVIRTDEASGFDQNVAKILTGLCNPQQHLEASFDSVRTMASMIKANRGLAYNMMLEVMGGDELETRRKLAAVSIADAFLTRLNNEVQNDTLEHREWAVPLTQTTYAFDPFWGQTPEQRQLFEDQIRLFKVARDNGYTRFFEEVDPRYSVLLANLEADV